ncbi:hypothetical protein HYT92_02235 [Candidatus Pacearchaeota archaeon]|nr:hypothetical protein [Candidatus Pacearchaeota archaeon]
MAENICAVVDKLISVGVDPNNPDPGLVGYHGTSEEAVKVLAERGILLPSGLQKDRKQKVDWTSGYLYFVPIKERFAGTPYFQRIWPGLIPENEFDVELYAQLKAFEHYLGERLKFVSPSRLLELADYWGATDVQREVFDRELTLLLRQASRRGIKPHTVHRLMEEAYQRQGMVVGLSNKIFELPIEPDPEGGEDTVAMRIKCEKGLPLEFIAGIQQLTLFKKESLDHHLRYVRKLFERKYNS